jgi:hypothetical protein
MTLAKIGSSGTYLAPGLYGGADHSPSQRANKVSWVDPAARRMRWRPVGGVSCRSWPRRHPRRVGKCSVCRHASRARLDYLAASGASLAPLAAQFGLKKSAIYNHASRHISEAYRAAIKIGPFESEEHLRRLCAESGVSVLDNLRAIYGGVASRWLVAFEAGADQTLALLTSRLQSNLELQGRLTRELMPTGGTINNNIIISDAVVRAVMAMHPTPEQRAAFADYYRQRSAAPLVIDVTA